LPIQMVSANACSRQLQFCGERLCQTKRTVSVKSMSTADAALDTLQAMSM
jgi:hypothetical protein